MTIVDRFWYRRSNLGHCRDCSTRRFRSTSGAALLDHPLIAAPKTTTMNHDPSTASDATALKTKILLKEPNSDWEEECRCSNSRPLGRRSGSSETRSSAGGGATLPEERSYADGHQFNVMLRCSYARKRLAVPAPTARRAKTQNAHGRFKSRSKGSETHFCQWRNGGRQAAGQHIGGPSIAVAKPRLGNLRMQLRFPGQPHEI